VTLTTDAPPVAALTADDLAALRRTDELSFHLYKGRYFIRLYLRSFGEQRIYTASEQRLFPNTDTGLGRTREIDVSGNTSGYVDHDDDGGQRWWGHDTTSAFYSLNGQYNDMWNTIKGLLKAEDELTLLFSGGAYNNGYTRPAGLHADRLSLAVKRGNRKMTFIVGVSVTADNTARMVKRHGL
jgi:hypothetical protein